MKLDWSSPDSITLLNPRLPDADRAALFESLKPHRLDGHIFLLTSGTSSLKWVALSKPAILACAHSVNKRFESNERDSWIHVLPDFHIGGIAIWARAFLSGANVIPMTWSAQEFVRRVREEKATLTSLVPAQVVDLVNAGLRSPESLRAIFVGGGALGCELLTRGWDLGWKLYPTYGMSECASQVATADDASGALKPLSHVEVQTDSDGHFKFRGPALLTGYVAQGRFVDPKVDGWFVSEDRGSIENGILRVQGRSSDFIKIGGENVNLARLQKILEGISLQPFAVVAAEDSRLGHVIHLVAAEGVDEAIVAQVIEAFNSRVLPFERIRELRRVAEIPRTALGKLQHGALQKLLS